MILLSKSWGTKKKSNKPATKIYWPELQNGRFRVYTRIYQIIKKWGPGPYNSLHYADNWKYFLGFSPRNRKEAHMFHLLKEVGKIWRCLAEEKVTWSWLLNSVIVKPEKSDYLHLVYHFTVPLSKK